MHGDGPGSLNRRQARLHRGRSTRSVQTGRQFSRSGDSRDSQRDSQAGSPRTGSRSCTGASRRCAVDRLSYTITMRSIIPAREALARAARRAGVVAGAAAVGEAGAEGTFGDTSAITEVIEKAPIASGQPAGRGRRNCGMSLPFPDSSISVRARLRRVSSFFALSTHQVAARRYEGA